MGIPRTREYKRICELPSRDIETLDVNSLVAKWSSRLRKNERESLYPLQAIALEEAATRKRGIVAPIPVGGGKTLLSLLLPKAYGLDSQSWALLVPASLVQKTIHEMNKLSRVWSVALNGRVLSYEKLGRVSGAHDLDAIRPRLIVADEAHRLKNYKAAVTRRVARYMHANPETMFVAMSGTLLQSSVNDLAHLCAWALGEGSPIPTNEEARGWADALGEHAGRKAEDFGDIEPAIEWLTPAERAAAEREGCTRTEIARLGFQKRFRSTPGVIAPKLRAQDDGATCSILLRGNLYDTPNATEPLFKKLREDCETPDGWALSQAVEWWRVAQQLALGLHYIWDPRPSDEWLEARRGWAKFVRDTLRGSRSLDSELSVAQALDRGTLRNPLGETALMNWRQYRAQYSYELKPVWHDRSALERAAEWLETHKGIVWCEHTFFAQALGSLAKVPVFGRQGMTRDGSQSIVHYRGGPIVASVAACSTGFNLQDRWHRNLVVSPSPSAKIWEQLIGRTHRNGQKADEVSVDYWVSCIENKEAIDRALLRSRMVRDMTGHEQKILLADHLEISHSGHGFAWSKPKTHFDLDSFFDTIDNE